MVPLCKLAQTSLALIKSPPTGHPQTAVKGYQTQSLYGQNLSESQPHPPSLKSQPPPLLQDAPLPIPEAEVLVTPLSWSMSHRGPSQTSFVLMTAHHRYHNYSGPRSLLSAQINPCILEYSWEKVAIGENIGGALAACYHVHHHEIPDVNLSPCHNRINEECLKIGDLISIAASW